MYFMYQATNGENKFLCVFFGGWGGRGVYVCFFSLSCCLQKEGKKKSKQYKVLKNASCQLHCGITWRLNVNPCSIFSNLDFAKVTLKTLMLFAVFTAKTADVLLSY